MFAEARLLLLPRPSSLNLLSWSSDPSGRRCLPATPAVVCPPPPSMPMHARMNTTGYGARTAANLAQRARVSDRATIGRPARAHDGALHERAIDKISPRGLVTPRAPDSRPAFPSSELHLQLQTHGRALPHWTRPLPAEPPRLAPVRASVVCRRVLGDGSCYRALPHLPTGQNSIPIGHRCARWCARGGQCPNHARAAACCWCDAERKRTTRASSTIEP